MKNTGEILKSQIIWESLSFPKDHYFERKLSHDPVIIFVIKGSLSLKVNGVEKYTVLSREMFMAQIDSSYEMTMLEQTNLLICYAPMDVWYTEQNWINDLFPDDKNIPDKFFKLPVKKIIHNFLSLMVLYLDEGIHYQSFHKIKRQELFILFFTYYQKNELAQFLQCILSKDIQFKKIVVANYLNAENVQALAKLANYSTSGFIKKFQKCFNDSPYKWMQRQKAKHISAEILNGTKSLQEIASEYKFSSYQHFSVFCKTQLGAPPTSLLEKLI